MTLRDINDRTKEGRLLLMAMAALSVSRDIHLNGQQRDGHTMEPDQILAEVEAVAAKVYADKGGSLATAQTMAIIYIAHPIGGDIEANLADLRRIVRLINENEPQVVPFVPYYADVVSLDDNNPWERDRGIQNDKAILKSGVIHAIWLTGDRISKGMAAEMELGEKLGIPVINKIGQF